MLWLHHDLDHDKQMNEWMSEKINDSYNWFIYILVSDFKGNMPWDSIVTARAELYYVVAFNIKII